MKTKPVQVTMKTRTFAQVSVSVLKALDPEAKWNVDPDKQDASAWIKGHEVHVRPNVIEVFSGNALLTCWNVRQVMGIICPNTLSTVQ